MNYLEINDNAHLLASQLIAKVGSWELDVENEHLQKSLRWTNECYRIFGYEPGEVEVSNDFFMSRVHPDDREKIKQTYDRALKEFTLYQIEHRIIKKDGSIAYVSENGEFLFEPDGKKPAKMLGTVQDITERKRAESILRETANNLRSILENSVTAYLILDHNKFILDHNKKANEMMSNIPGKEIKRGSYYPDIVPAERKAVVEDLFKAVDQSKETITYDVNYTSYSKSSLWLSVKVIPLINEDQMVHGYCLSALDITKRKEDEDEIREKNHLLEHAQKAANLGSWVVDLHANTSEWSDECLRIFGLTRENFDPTQEAFFAMVHPDDLNELKAKSDIAFSEKKIFSHVHRINRKNGETRWVHSMFETVYENDVPVKLLGNTQDITQQKLTEIERSSIISELIQRNKELEQFTYMVSHNLRHSVANIIGYAVAIKDQIVTHDEQRILIDEIELCASKLDDGLKDLSKILKAKSNVAEQKEMVSLEKLYDDIVYGFASQLDDQIIISADFSEAPMFNTIKSYMHHIMFNLISNAIKFRRAGLPSRIVIKTSRSKSKFTMSVTDNGLGIDLEKYKNDVFGLYKRFHTHIDGKGLGLFMVKTYVEHLNGKVSMESEVNEGTRITMDFIEQIT